MAPEPTIQLIVTGEDFGSSRRVNSAIRTAHRDGILTSASLMVNESSTDAAVAIAHENPSLGVGLHLTLVRGRSTLKPSEINGMVDHKFYFDDRPLRAGLRYLVFPRYHIALRQEMDAQIRRFRVFGLPLEYLDGHLHYHLHPVVSTILRRNARHWRIPAVRVVREPMVAGLRLSGGRGLSRIPESLLLSWLGMRTRRSFGRRGIAMVDAVFGLMGNGRFTEASLLRWLDGLRDGTVELYCRLQGDGSEAVLGALCSPSVRRRIEDRGIRLIRYRDLHARQEAAGTESPG